MSRRESCVWHPMPQEVRRSSIQSRRASLAAGRRASVAKDQPDWEVEAAPALIQSRATAADTYPTEDAAPAAAAAPETYPTKEPIAQSRAVAAEPKPEVVPSKSEPAKTHPTKEPIAQSRAVAAEPKPEVVPSKSEPAKTHPTKEPIAQSRAVAAEPKPEVVPSSKSEPAEEHPTKKPAPAAAKEKHAPAPIEKAPAVVQEEPTAASHKPVEKTQLASQKAGRAKTRHTIHFRGSKWAEVNSSNFDALKAAFFEDLKNGAGVEADEAKSVNFAMKTTLTATFVMYHPKGDRTRMQAVHRKLKDYAFPKVCALYSPTCDEDEL